MILHFMQIFLTDARTFISVTPFLPFRSEPEDAGLKAPALHLNLNSCPQGLKQRPCAQMSELNGPPKTIQPNGAGHGMLCPYERESSRYL